MATGTISRLVVLVLVFVIFPRESPACEDGYPSSPQGVVQAYLEQDATRGKDHWQRISQFTTWVDAPGWDVTILISGFRITGRTENSRDADVGVEYLQPVQFYSEEAGPVLEKLPDVEQVVFHLINVGGCWKIHAPQNPPHFTAKYVIDDLSREVAADNPKPQEMEVLNELRAYYVK